MQHHRILPLLLVSACAEVVDEPATGALASTIPEIEVLAAGLSMPTSLATDGATLYWIDIEDQTLCAMPENGGAITILAHGAYAYTPWAIATDATYVYWLDADDGAVLRTPKAGGATVTLASGEGEPLAIGVDASYVYWTTGASFRRVSKYGGLPRTIATGSTFSAFVVDSWFAYIADAHVLGGSNQIVRVPKSGGAKIVLSSDEDALGIAGDAQALYWKRFWTGDVRRGSKWMPGATTVASDGGGWGDLATSATSVWWTGGSVLKRAPKSGGETEYVHDFTSWANSIALDGEVAYLALDEGAIVRLAD